MNDAIPRPEHPRPQFHREAWSNLNGTWTCSIDAGDSGIDRGLARATGCEQRIRVPFCPESPLSGIAHRDFIPAIWYHRRLAIPAAWRDRRILLHCGGVDYRSTVYVDGVRAGQHYGGAASFSHDIRRRHKRLRHGGVRGASAP